MEKKLYVLVCHNPEVDIYIFTSIRKCKKYFIEDLYFEENEWELLMDGDRVMDDEAYYWELRKEPIYP